MRLLSSPRPTDTLNVQLHTEQFLMKAIQKLVERLLHIGQMTAHPPTSKCLGKAETLGRTQCPRAIQSGADPELPAFPWGAKGLDPKSSIWILPTFVILSPTSKTLNTHLWKPMGIVSMRPLSKTKPSYSQMHWVLTSHSHSVIRAEQTSKKSHILKSYLRMRFLTLAHI